MKRPVHSAQPAAPLAALPLALAAACSPFLAFAQAATPLKPVVVTATRFAEAADTLPLGVSVFTAEEIRNSGATTVTEALMRLAGVPGRQDFYGGGEYNLDLRGFGATADNNQVFILDGQRLSEADLGGTRLAGIPIESIARIEILRGSGAVLYGEGATGGVVVITTKGRAGIERQTGGSAYLGLGTFNTREARASGTVASGGFSMDANVQRRTSDNHRDNFRSEGDAASLALQWSGDSLRVGASLAQDRLDSRLPGGISEAQFDADPSQTNTPNDWGKIRNTRAHAYLEYDWAGWQFAADAGQRKRTLRSENSGFPFDYDIDANNYSLRARHQGTIAGVKNQLVFGHDHHEWQRDVLGLFGSSSQQRSRAWYVKDDVILGTGTRVSAGARSERISKDSSGMALADRLEAWELGASQALGHGVTAYARIGRSFRLANVDEFSFSSPGAVLQPQTSRDYELGARWAHAAGGVEARLYRSNLTNEIGYDPNAAGPFGFGANVNFDPTRREGLELDATHQLTRTVGLRLNAAVRNSTFRAGAYDGQDVPLTPKRTLALRADWTPAADHRLSGGVNWVSSQHVDYANTCTVPSYAVADLRYAFQWKQAELSLGVANLFDRKYYTQAFGCVAGAALAVYPEPGRAFTAALRVSF